MNHPIFDLLRIIKRLRDKTAGCPWDIEQTLSSLTKHILEEAYEVVDAIERHDMNHLKEELGDLLLQVVFVAEIAKEQHHFDFHSVTEQLNEKLVNRHPHVFNPAQSPPVSNAADQEQHWETIKEKEKRWISIKKDRRLYFVHTLSLLIKIEAF